MANAPVVSPVLSVSPPPCKDERFSVGMEEWTVVVRIDVIVVVGIRRDWGRLQRPLETAGTDSASKSPLSRSPTRPVTRKRQRYSKGEQVWEEPLPRGLR